MATAVTHGIRITARARYEEAHSDAKAGRFIFSYRITISNRSEETVQLLHRHWTIHDSLAPVREVDGPGVVGETPVLAPGEEFSYSSACDLRSGFGRMEGNYRMLRARDGLMFHVQIPTMQLASPFLVN
ncbi:MAG: Co2+/Mg2+ efflux protein ApaG [Flavobacteriales bacterium]|nr:Co2+/Mg2+ efflux protein ApaG [Flavobacteriales bacterium]MBL0126313.1 Co2+/Mg2+ efflux protein ApaG [Flavobacteriales bacterium]MCC6936956.1 Co2+/Mg2+ efflux protein ApaG [Flavobacteriales bacterium]